MATFVQAEVLPPLRRARRRRTSGLAGCLGCPSASSLACAGCPFRGLGQAGGSYSYATPGGQVMTMTWPAGGPLNWQDTIVAWVQQNPMLAIIAGFVLGVFAAGGFRRK